MLLALHMGLLSATKTSLNATGHWNSDYKEKPELKVLSLPLLYMNTPVSLQRL